MLYTHLVMLLLFGHALADYPFQGELLSKSKTGTVPGFPWWVGLSAHSFIHAGMVLLFTNSVPLAIAELVAHFAIDKVKCCNRINLVTDQTLHVICKLVWAYIALS